MKPHLAARVEIHEVKASRLNFLAVVLIKVLVDSFIDDGVVPRQNELYGTHREDEQSGLVNDFLYGRGKYSDFKYAVGKPISIFAFGFSGGRTLLDITRMLESHGFIEPRGSREEGTRNEYTPTKDGIAFVQSLLADWRKWDLPDAS